MKRYIVKRQSVGQVKKALATSMRHYPTEEETILWDVVRASRLGPKFRRQQVIHGFIVDFYCASHGLVIECDGSHHSVDNDTERDCILTSLNIKILRFSNHEIRNNLVAVTSKISEEIVAKVGPGSFVQHYFVDDIANDYWICLHLQ